MANRILITDSLLRFHLFLFDKYETEFNIMLTNVKFLCY